MSDLVEIILQAIDNASSVFESVSTSASGMADQIANATGLADDEFTTLENTVTGFQDAVTNIDSTSIDELATELGMSTDEVERLIDAGSQIGSIPFNEAAASAGELETSVAGADDAVQDLGNDLDIINSSMMLQLGEQIGNLGSQAEGMSQEMNSAAISVGQLATQTGIAEPQMVSLINNISNATFPNDEAMMYVKSLDQMGVSAENLGESATNIDRINDAFGLGAQTTNSLAQELGVLGVDMNNVNTSFNALAYANANTVGGMQNYYSFLRKYDAQFKELGYDVDQSSIIIAAATQKYGGGRAALSGLSEALETADGDTRKLEEALGIQAGTLDNASAVTGQYEGQLQALADEEAEHKTFLDQLGAAWEDASLSLSGILSPLTSFAGLIGGLGSFAMQINGLKTLTDTMKGFNIQQTITNALEGEGAIARVASALGITTEAAAAEGATVAFGGLAIAEGAALWPILAIAAAIAALIVIVYEIGKAFGWWEDVGGMLDAISAGLNRLWEAFINNPDVQAFIQAINTAWAAMVSAVQPAIDAVLSFFGVNMSGNFDIVRALINGIGWAWNTITAPIRSVIGLIWQVINVFQSLISGQITLQQAITLIWGAITSYWRTILTRLATILTSTFTRMVNNAKQKAQAIVTGVITQITTLPGRMSTQLLKGVTSIVTAGGQWVSNARTQAGKVVSGVSDKLSGIGSSITSALSGVVNAFTKPFKDAYNAVVDWVGKIKSEASKVPVIGGAFGGAELAYGGLDLLDNINNEVTVNDKLEVNVHNDVDLTLDLRNVPGNFDEATLHSVVVDTLTSKEVLSQLVNNNDFQTLDNRAKARILARNNRARGA